MKQADRLAALRAQFVKYKVDGFLVPKADEFQGEYIPERAERLAWLTGFTGSAGNAVVLKDAAMVQTDSRYDIQIRQQVDANLYSTTMNTDITLHGWIAQNAKPGQVIGYDPKLHTPNQIKSMESGLKDTGVILKALDDNLLDAIWNNRPAMPAHPVEIFPTYIAGRSADEKRAEIASRLTMAGADAAVITLPDSIAWLLNIRGHDVPHTPLALSNAIIYADGRVDWFIDPAKVPADVHAHIGHQVQVHDPEDIEDALKALSGKTAVLDCRKSSIWFKQKLESSGAKIKDMEDPCILPKACKTPEEQDGIRNAHFRDGVAVTKFLAWLDRDGVKQKNLTELDVADMLESFRRQDPTYRDSSFDTIAGWGANGAIVHYRATPEKHAVITPPGLLLLDSGGQYANGTTDITRTIPIGTPSDEMKKAFTLVLKGHIAIAAVTFPDGVKGADIDTLARKALWAHGMDYGHGTGHGVGCYLSVHEEGGGISALAARPFKPGMVVSNEPGYYKQGDFGIRIESLVLVNQIGSFANGKTLMGFETLTLAPIDKRLIDLDLMNHEEIAWLNDYHARVEKLISPRLDADEQKWLKAATSPLKKPDAAGPRKRRQNKLDPN